MPEPSEELQEELNPLLIPIFYGAFHPYQLTVALPVGAGILGYLVSADTAIVLGTLAFFSVPFVWIGAVLYVNQTYRPKTKSFIDEAASIGRRIFGTAGEDTNSFTIEHGYGTVRLVRPYRVIAPISIIVGDSSLLVYDDAKLQLDRLHADFGTGTREFFFDSIASINYDRPYFEIKLIDGDAAQYRSTRKPDSVLHDIQQRLREYKRDSTSD